MIPLSCTLTPGWDGTRPGHEKSELRAKQRGTDRDQRRRNRGPGRNKLLHWGPDGQTGADICEERTVRWTLCRSVLRASWSCGNHQGRSRICRGTPTPKKTAWKWKQLDQGGVGRAFKILLYRSATEFIYFERNCLWEISSSVVFRSGLSEGRRATCDSAEGNPAAPAELRLPGPRRQQTGVYGCGRRGLTGWGGRGQTHHSQVGQQKSMGAGGEYSQDEEEAKPLLVLVCREEETKNHCIKQ